MGICPPLKRTCDTKNFIVVDCLDCEPANIITIAVIWIAMVSKISFTSSNNCDLTLRVTINICAFESFPNLAPARLKLRTFVNTTLRSGLEQERLW